MPAENVLPHYFFFFTFVSFGFVIPEAVERLWRGPEEAQGALRVKLMSQSLIKSR